VTQRGRLIMVLIAAGGFAVLFMRGLTGGARLRPLPRRLRPGPQRRFGPRAPHPVVTAVNFDYRGFDTMGEEFILFASVVSVALLLRAQRGETEQRDPQDARAGRAGEFSEAVRVMGLGLGAPTVVFASTSSPTAI
jgi:multicomponent Na+:H+ antiporter subunit B